MNTPNRRVFVSLTAEAVHGWVVDDAAKTVMVYRKNGPPQNSIWSYASWATALAKSEGIGGKPVLQLKPEAGIPSYWLTDWSDA